VTLLTPIKGITDDIYRFGSPFLLLRPYFSTRPQQVLPFQMTGGQVSA